MAYGAILRARFGSQAPEASALYPARSGDVPFQALLRNTSVFSLVESPRKARARAAHRFYDHAWTHIGPGSKSGRYRAFHTSEVPYVLATLDKPPQRAFTKQDRRISDVMSTSWANFVKTGNRNGARLPFWPASQNAGHVIELDGQFDRHPPLDLRLFWRCAGDWKDAVRC